MSQVPIRLNDFDAGCVSAPIDLEVVDHPSHAAYARGDLLGAGAISRGFNIPAEMNNPFNRCYAHSGEIDRLFLSEHGFHIGGGIGIVDVLAECLSGQALAARRCKRDHQEHEYQTAEGASHKYPLSGPDFGNPMFSDNSKDRRLCAKRQSGYFRNLDEGFSLPRRRSPRSTSRACAREDEKRPGALGRRILF